MLCAVSLLFAMCCLLLFVGDWLFAVCCVLFAVRCSLCVVCCLLCVDRSLLRLLLSFAAC